MALVGCLIGMYSFADCHSIACAQTVPSMLTNHNDNGRTGANLNEYKLNKDTVNEAHFGKLFSLTVDGQVYAQPLYLPNVEVQGKGRHNVVYIATQRGSVYAFDADDNDGSNNRPLWHVCLVDRKAGDHPVRSSDFDIPLAAAYRDLAPEIGITGTPVISQDCKTLYAVAATSRRGGYRQNLFALDTASGKIISSTEIEWKGKKSDKSGPPVIFHPRQQLQRAGLLYANGVVYVAFGSHGDLPINAISIKNLFNLLPGYHGWIFAYDARTLKRLAVYNATPKARDTLFHLLFKRTLAGGGIWMSGAGLSEDGKGNIYFSTGNGAFTAHKQGAEYGDSVVKMHLAGEAAGRKFNVTDFFAPHNQDYLNDKDLDLGSSGVLLIPGRAASEPEMLAVGGKEGFLYLLDRNNLGHFDKDKDHCLDSFLASFSTPETKHAVNRPGGARPAGHSRVRQTPALVAQTKAAGERTEISNIHSAPVYWETPIGPYVYIWGEEDVLKGFRLKDAKLLHGDKEVAHSLAKLSSGMPGAALSISANGSAPGTGILWATHPYRGDANHEIVPGVLRAFDAAPGPSDGKGPVLKELWASRPTRDSRPNTSGRAFTADDLGDFAKFCPPTIVNGKVYVPTFSSQVEVYGLFDRRTILPAIADAYVQAGDLANLTMRDRHDFLPIDDRLQLKEEIVLRRVSHTPDSRYNSCGYLLFDLTTVREKPRSAMLTLTIGKSRATDSSAIVKVYAVDDSAWIEELITWNTAPGLKAGEFLSTGKEVASHRVFFKKGTVTFDLTNFVASHLGQFVTLQLMTEGLDELGVEFLSGRKQLDGVSGSAAPPSIRESLGSAGDPILVLNWF